MPRPSLIVIQTAAQHRVHHSGVKVGGATLPFPLWRLDGGRRPLASLVNSYCHSQLVQLKLAFQEISGFFRGRGARRRERNGQWQLRNLEKLMTGMKNNLNTLWAKSYVRTREESSMR